MVVVAVVAAVVAVVKLVVVVVAVAAAVVVHWQRQLQWHLQEQHTRLGHDAMMADDGFAW